jgi:hypothetical protein
LSRLKSCSSRIFCGKPNQAKFLPKKSLNHSF